MPEFRRVDETKEIGTNTEPIVKAKKTKEIGTNTDAMLFVPAKLPRAPYTSSDDSSEENEREKAPPVTAEVLKSPSQKLLNSLHKYDLELLMILFSNYQTFTLNKHVILNNLN